MMAGMDGSGSGRVVVTASVLLLLAALLAVLAAVPQRVERTPRAIDWRVVGAGVKGCGSEVAALELLESAKLAVAVGAWWGTVGGACGAEMAVPSPLPDGAPSTRELGGYESAAESGIVGCGIIGCTSMHGLPLCGRGDAVRCACVDAL